MDEQDIELLKTLIDTQNITKTAKKLYTTQSSLTKRIQKMEQDLGCQLFIRSRKGILPTPAAEGIFPEIEKISQSMEHIRAYALSLQGEICGSLKIGVSVNIARYKLPAVLKTLINKYLFIPVLLKCFPFNGLNVQLGPKLGIGLSLSDKWKGINNDDYSIYRDSAVDFSLAFGLGYEFNFGVFVDARYTLGLTKTIREVVKGFQGRNISLAVGYRVYL